MAKTKNDFPFPPKARRHLRKGIITTENSNPLALWIVIAFMEALADE